MLPGNRMLSKTPSLSALIRVTGQSLASESPLSLHIWIASGEWSIPTTLAPFRWRWSDTRPAAADVERAATDVFHRLAQVGIPLVELGEVPPGMFIDLNVVIIALADFTKVFRQQTSVMVVELLSENIHFRCWTQRD